MEMVSNQIMSPEAILNHWQGHRNLTRRVIEAFPEKELFTFSIGGMRSFAQLVTEMLSIGGPGLKGIVNKAVSPYSEDEIKLSTKKDLLEKWDAETEVIDRYFRQIP